jgi:hypothetical protein
MWPSSPAADALGPDPGRRLMGDLTPQIAGRLHVICRTDAAAATALALHLNHTPRDFDVCRLGLLPSWRVSVATMWTWSAACRIATHRQAWSSP